MQFSSIEPIDKALSGVIPGQSELGSNGNEKVYRIPQSSSITGTLPSDCLVSYQSYSFDGESYPSAEVQSVYSTAPADWATLLPALLLHGVVRLLRSNIWVKYICLDIIHIWENTITKQLQKKCKYELMKNVISLTLG